VHVIVQVATQAAITGGKARAAQPVPHAARQAGSPTPPEYDFWIKNPKTNKIDHIFAEWPRIWM
jgi:hypothetical protein